MPEVQVQSQQALSDALSVRGGHTKSRRGDASPGSIVWRALWVPGWRAVSPAWPAGHAQSPQPKDKADRRGYKGG